LKGVVKFKNRLLSKIDGERLLGGTLKTVKDTVGAGFGRSLIITAG
jgi:hypothetical protein